MHLHRPSLVSLALGAWAVLLMGVATVASAYVARETAVGPVLVTLSPHHGVHAGDVTVAVIAYGGAVVGSGTAAGLQVLRLRERATRPLGA